MIAAIALGVLALLSLSYLFFGGSSSSPKKTVQNSNAVANTSPTSLTASSSSTSTRPANIPSVKDLQNDPLQFLRPIVYSPTTPPQVPASMRNIFAFYIAPLPTPKPTPIPTPPPTPVPTPTPPLLVASVSPSNVYARQDDFTLEVNGDKFTPQTHIVLGGSELPTRFINAQQLSATVPAVMITNEGQRPVIARTPDGQLYSNTATLSVSPAPLPNYSFVGILGKKRFNDTAVLRDKASKDLLNVQRGDVVGGRFRVTSISEREVALIDNTLHIKHALPFNSDGSDPNSRNPQTSMQPRTQPQPPPKSEEDEDEIP